MKKQAKLNIEIDVDGNRCDIGNNTRLSCPFIRYIDTFKYKCELFHIMLEFDFKEKYEDGHRPLRCKQCKETFK